MATKSAAARTVSMFGPTGDLPLFSGQSYRVKVLGEVHVLREKIASAQKAHAAYEREINSRIEELLRSLEHGPRRL